ncbi:MAG: glycogen/starch/alpha-glucan phosphorylase [Clostridia bacterium]|nr:glycogen/starch/alpha-glucan phosphorylase [Clostridia bacterium]
MQYPLTKKQINNLIVQKLSHNFGLTPEEADNEHLYKACALAVTDLLRKRRKEFSALAQKQDKKRVYYLCMEFLLGRSLKNNLYNMGLEENFKDVLAGYGAKLDKLYECEPDAGLGNGGLGRLAACFMDALASQGYIATGYSLRYEYGIFKQKIVDGWQTELPDFWLPGGDVWLIPHTEDKVEVKFGGHIDESWEGGFHHAEHRNYDKITAVPYDMMISGKGGGVSCLRLWAAVSEEFDMNLFNEGDYLRAIERKAMAQSLTQVLYPGDNHPEGKSLRLSQQYFLVSASIQDIIKRHLRTHRTLNNLPEAMAIHINDTHPALAIPELMRVLIDECGYGWESAWNIVSKTIAYTNHTVMSEALECWGEELFKTKLPRIYQITMEINRRFCDEMTVRTGYDRDKVEHMAIVNQGFVKMANLAVASCHKVNGVSQLHSDIIKDDLFNNFYTMMPEKFTNVTNGIAYRRWLCQSNPGLTALITELIGDKFILDDGALEELIKYKDDPAVLQRLAKIKRENKERIAKYILENNGVKVNLDSIFDVQVKRLHEYKRQHLNALHILAQYHYILDHPDEDVTPKTYIFGAKAASGYFMAKQIINLIVCLGNMINNDPRVKDKLKVIFLEDYRVTVAEKLIPAAEISEQISLAGKEASGTSNMKFMINGAITLGTEDGANVEIHEAVGDDNIVIFGMSAGEVTELRKKGYNPRVYNNNLILRRCLDGLNSDIGGKNFSSIASDLLTRDPYMVLADFEDYCRAHKRAIALYNDPEKWNSMSLVNIAKAGIFSADRSIRDYAQNIWNTTPVDFNAKAEPRKAAKNNKK